MTRQGRELERLVAILEEALRPEGVRVVSPDRLRDTVTGRMREVDVSIRSGEAGSLLAICECRDRRAVADVTWVEQVVTKATDLEESPPVLLVSASGFTPEAVTKAASYGHETRLLTDVSIEELRSWFEAEHVEVIVTTRALHGCEVRFTPEDAEDFSLSIKEALTEHGFDAPIFERQTLPPLSPNQLFEKWYKRLHERVARDVPPDGRPVRRNVPLQFEEPERSLAVDTNVGRRAVATVHLRVEVKRERRLVPASRSTRYSNEQAELAQSVEFHLGQGFGTISAHRVPGDPTRIQYRNPEE